LEQTMKIIWRLKWLIMVPFRLTLKGIGTRALEVDVKVLNPCNFKSDIDS